MQTELFIEKKSFCRTNRLLKKFVERLEACTDLASLAFTWDTNKPMLEFYTWPVKVEMTEIKDKLKLKLNKISELKNTDNSDSVNWCDCCKDMTKQVIELFNPDDPDSAKVWQCTSCLENIGFVDEFTTNKQSK